MGGRSGRCVILGITAILIFLVSLVGAAVDVSKVKVYKIVPRYGSRQGASRLTITGTGFSEDQFNFGAGRDNLGNKVKLVSKTRSYDCDPHKDGNTKTQITCDTRAMEIDDYYVRISVDGEEVPAENHCNSLYHSYCRHSPHAHWTPTIESLGQPSDIPGQVQTINGRIMTSRFGSNVESTNSRTQKILRVYAGGQLCNPRKDEGPDLPDVNDELYGIELKNDGSSDSGYLKCKMAGTYVGNHNFSFIIEEFGRSYPEPAAYRVTADDKIAMFQTYAEIYNVTPSTGSEEGGTRITIRGRYFDQTDAPARVDIAGVACKVVSLQDDVILCDTAPKPQTLANTDAYPGNRGLDFGFYTDASLLNEFETVATHNETVENSTWLDETYWTEAEFNKRLNNYMARITTYFVPPRDADYTFSIPSSDDASRLYLSQTGNISDLTQVAVRPANTQYSHVSQKFRLQAGKAYPLVHVTRENTGYAWANVAVQISTTSLPGGRAVSAVKAERQEIFTGSNVNNEVQIIKLSGWRSQSKRSEIQRVTITSDALSYVSFRIGMGGVWTAPLAGDASATTVKNELNTLPSIQPDSVTVSQGSMSGGVKFDVTFSSALGDVDMLTAELDVNTNRANATLSVTERTKGKSDMSVFALKFLDAVSPPISVTASADDVKQAVKTLFEVRCPEFLTKPKTRIAFNLDFESAVKYSESGTRVTDVEPFCGGTSVKNPSWLYRDHSTLKTANINLMLTGKLCFAYMGKLQQKVYVAYNYKSTTQTTSKGVGDLYTVTIPESQKWNYICIDLKTLLQTRRQGLTEAKVTRIYIYRDTSTENPIYVDNILVVSSDPTTDLQGVAQYRRMPPPMWMLDDVDVSGNATWGYRVDMTVRGCRFNLPMFSVLGAQPSSTDDDSDVTDMTNSNETDLFTTTELPLTTDLFTTTELPMTTDTSDISDPVDATSNTVEQVVYQSATWKNGASVTVERELAATPPINGTFSLTIGSKTLNNVAADVDAHNLKLLLETVPEMGVVDVVRTGSCSGYNWRVTWSSVPGDQGLMSLNGNNLVGPDNITSGVKASQDGGVYLNPIPGDFIRTVHDTPQVQVDINKIPSRCRGDCSFTWAADVTPSLSAINPTSGSNSAGTVITLTGQGFSTTNSENQVIIGGEACSVSSATSAEIQCTVGKGPAGPQDVVLIVDQKGQARNTNGLLQFTYGFAISSIEPNSGSVAGGLVLTVNGTGFSSNVTATIGGANCPILTATYGSLTCRTPAASAGAQQVALSDGSQSTTAGTQFTYSNANTPVVTSISQSSFTVSAGQSITISGSGFGATAGADAVSINGEEASVTSYTNTEIQAGVPLLPPGSYPLRVHVPGKGYADTTSNSIGDLTVDLSVTNVYPLSGSMEGGSVVTVTGSGFSADTSQVKVTLDGKQCDVINSTTSQITCTAPSAATVNTITNNGVHPTFGQSYAWSQPTIDILVGDSIKWTWAAPDRTSSMYSIQEVISPYGYVPKTDGFDSGAKRSTGAFQYQFTNPGTHYYWSGYVDSEEAIEMRGTVNVAVRSASAVTVEVKVNGHSATYNTGSGVGNPTFSGSCNPTYPSVSGCSESSPSKSGSGFEFEYLKCKTPVITSISPNQGSSDDTITITGSGLGGSSCQNVVTVGEQSCTVTSASASRVTCKVNTQGEAEIGVLKPVRLTISNIGNALNTEPSDNKRYFVLMPHISNISPTAGSVKGGTDVTITGSGFYGQVAVTIGSVRCQVSSLSYTRIVCVTDTAYVGNDTLTVKVPSNGQSVDALCQTGGAGSCDFRFRSDLTPTVSAIRPSTISSNDTELVITGSGFGNSQADLNVTMGGEDCRILDMNDTSISCVIDSPVAGTHAVRVVLRDRGLADASGVTLTVNGVVSSVVPNSGSIKGGNVLSLTGVGFKKGDTTVMVGNSLCSELDVKTGEVRCRAPGAGAEGAVKVQVLSNSVSFPKADYTYAAADTPTVSALSATSGKTGDSLTLTGTGFSTNTADMSVTIDEVACGIVGSVSATSLTCTLGVHSAGEYPVVVQHAGKGLATTDLNFTYTLQITGGVDPNQGSYGGGQVITLSGIGFDASGTNVTVCDAPCAITGSVTATSLSCTTPHKAIGGATTVCDVKVTVADQVATAASAFTYSQSLTPTITAVSPRRGGTGGGTRVTITGTNFGTNSANVKVNIAGTTCSLESVTDTQVICTTASRKPSIQTKITLEIGSNGIATQDQADFEYIDVWSSQFTWNYSMPETGDFVVIPSDMTVLLDTDTPVLKMLLINGGKLIFDEKDVELQAENILITNGGLLQIGTESQPHQSRAIITLWGHPRSQELPIYGTKTIAVREGTVDLHGKAPSHSWTVLGATANAGDGQITLKEAVDWKVGDFIAIGSTGDHLSQNENEERQITAVSNGGKTLSLHSPLQYKHLGERVDLGSGYNLDAHAPVGLLTRNILIRGSNNSQWADKIEACPAGFNPGEFAVQTCFQGRFGEETGSDQYGAQIMFHPARPDEGLVTGRIENIEMTYAGQAFRLGRYAIHFHLNGNMMGNYVRGCAIHHSFNRAVNIHGTHYVTIYNNVVFDIMGGAIFLEDGIEIGNTFDSNLAIFVKGSSSLQNDDITPAAYWLTNPNNTVINNFAAGGTHFGFWYRMHKHPDGPSFDSNYCPQHIELGLFRNNTVMSHGWFGIWIFQEYYPMEGGGCGSNQPIAAKWFSLTAWNNEKGAEWVGGGALQFHDFFLVNNKLAGIEMKLMSHTVSFSEERGGMLKDNIIVARPLNDGVMAKSTTQAAIINPYARGLLIKGNTFVNFDQSGSSCFGVTTVTGTTSTSNGGFTYRTTGLTFHNSPNKIGFRWIHEAVFHDLDGSLTGIAGGKAVPTTPILPNDKCTHNVPAVSANANVPGSVCQADVDFTRFSFNQAAPNSLNQKVVSFTNTHGTTSSVWMKKRVTHKKGWMVLLATNSEYKMEFVNGEHLTNITYTGTFYDMSPNDYIVLSHNLTQKPDHFGMVPGQNTQASTSMVSYGSNDNGAWYFNDASTTVSYLLSGKSPSSGRRRRKRAAISPPESGTLDRDVKFQVFRCFYKDCLVPGGGNTLPPPVTRPDDAKMWSDTETWSNIEEGWGGNYGDGTYGLPREGDDVMIPAGEYVVADTTLPVMGKLYIYGTLELEYLPDSNGRVRDFVLNCTHIFINGGRLVVGWENERYTGNAQIVLRGNHLTPDIPLPNGPNMGSKVMGVFGGLELHGIERQVTWTRLSQTASAGENSINVEEPVDWAVGEEIVIAPTGYSAWETEVMKITGLSNGNKTLALNGTLKNSHKVTTNDIGGGQSVKLAAEVGLLTRNIKIVGAPYDKMYEQAFGARVLVGTYAGDSDDITGYARLSNVEFYLSGQEGWTDEYDPRFSIAYLDVGDATEVKPSTVRKCSFHHGFAPAIGVFGSNKVNVTDNVIYHTVGSAIQDSGMDNAFRRNLVTLMAFPGTYNGKEEERPEWDAGIDVHRATRPVLTGNAVGGSERAGFWVDGEPCDGSTEAWSDNTAHSVLVGVQMLPGDGLPACSKLGDFTVYKAWDFGMYFQVSSSNVQVVDFTSVDNRLGVFPMILGPGATSHAFENKKVDIKNSVFIGKTSGFDCTNDKLAAADEKNLALSSAGRSWRSSSGGFVGISASNFVSGSNGAPTKPWINLMSYNAIGGLTLISGTKFVGFQSHCSGKLDTVITSSPNNDDMQHPIRMQAITLKDVDVDNKVSYHRPRLGTINPSDCVDMDCDGLKKLIIDDLDGSFLSSKGTIIPHSEWEWDGDRRRGLGDYRIPKTLLTTVDGDRIPVNDIAPHKGIIRDNTCSLKTAYRAYECHGLDYEMLVLESMDSDTETRRLSPIAILGDGYLDLINGPQDHGWCMGYTCQKRLSTFPIVVATGKYYILHYTGTSPQHTRLRLLNSDESQAFVVGIFYAIPQRLDVYVDDQYVVPENAEYDANGDQIRKAPTYSGQYMPNVNSSVSGANYFDRSLDTIHVLVRGPTAVEIRTSPMLVIGFDLPAMTVDDFYGANLVNNLATFLGIPAHKIKVAKAVPETRGRRKRSTVFKVELEISNPPANNTNATQADPDALSYDTLQNMTSTIVNSIQLGTLGSMLNVTILDFAITEPVPSPDSSAWRTVIATADSGQTYSFQVQIPHRMAIETEPVGFSEGNPLTVHPVLKFYDKNGDLVQQLGAKTAPWQVTAWLVKVNASAPHVTLSGNTTADFVLGYANFTDLIIDYSGTYRLDYSISYPAEATTLFTARSAEFYIAERSLGLSVASQDNETAVGQTFTVVAEIIDAVTLAKVDNIAWKNHTWTCTVALYMPELYSGELQGTLTVPIDPNTGLATFNDLTLTAQGRYYLRLVAISTPAAFNLEVVSGLIDARPVGWAQPTARVSRTVKIKFNVDYNSTLSGRADYLEAAIHNKVYTSYSVANISLGEVTFTEGSILATFTVSGSESGVTAAVSGLHGVVSSGGFSFIFFGQTLTADPVMWVDDVQQAVPVTVQSLTAGVIAAIVICCLVVVIVVVLALVLLKIKLNGKKKIGSEPELLSHERQGEDGNRGNVGGQDHSPYGPGESVPADGQMPPTPGRDQIYNNDLRRGSAGGGGATTPSPLTPRRGGGAGGGPLPPLPRRQSEGIQEIALDASPATRPVPISEQPFSEGEEQADVPTGSGEQQRLGSDGTRTGSAGSKGRVRPPNKPSVVWDSGAGGNPTGPKSKKLDPFAAAIAGFTENSPYGANSPYAAKMTSPSRKGGMAGKLPSLTERLQDIMPKKSRRKRNKSKRRQSDVPSVDSGDAAGTTHAHDASIVSEDTLNRTYDSSATSHSGGGGGGTHDQSYYSSEGVPLMP